MEGCDFRFARRKTRSVKVRDISIGGEFPISIQTMLSVSTTAVDLVMTQIRKLGDAGCDIARLAIPDESAAEAFGVIRKRTGMPLVADIHFDHRLAIFAAKAGADKLRINPGNIGSKEKVLEVAQCAKVLGIPIRIGVNAGSLPKDLTQGEITPEKLVEAASREIEILRGCAFEDIVVSMKSHSAAMTIEANRLFSKMFDYPLHIGVTEAGLPGEGGIKNAVGIGTLLMEGIGDTIRVSLTGDPIGEIVAGRHILRACGILKSGIELVSCPTCGRCKGDVAGITEEISKRLPQTKKHLVVAIMGCEVNGPGEARAADIGIAGGDGYFLLFKKGIPSGKIPQSDAVEILLKEINEFIQG